MIFHLKGRRPTIAQDPLYIRAASLDPNLTANKFWCCVADRSGTPEDTPPPRMKLIQRFQGYLTMPVRESLTIFLLWEIVGAWVRRESTSLPTTQKNANPAYAVPTERTQSCCGYSESIFRISLAWA
jgi:hypothetical protein